jgi:hypothetical protein
MNLAPYVESILRDLKIPGGRTSALHTLRAFHLTHQALTGDLIMELADAVEPGPGTITLGEGALLYANPARQGYAWRCGECLHVFRRGDPDPKSGVNYKTLRGASNAAHKHSDEDHAGRVPVKEVAP